MKRLKLKNYTIALGIATALTVASASSGSAQTSGDSAAALTRPADHARRAHDLDRPGRAADHGARFFFHLPAARGDSKSQAA